MTESIPRWEQKLSSYERALARLAEVINLSRQRLLTDIEKDGMVQRFEFTHEVAWKLMKSYAEYQGISDVGGSRDATRGAFELGLIADGEAWMGMIKSRNETSHNYDGQVADEVVERICGSYFDNMVAFFDRMKTLSSRPKDLFSNE